MKRFALALVMTFLCLAACTPQTQLPKLPEAAVEAEARKQQDLAFKEHMAKLDRLTRIAWKVRAENAALCGERTAYALGFSANLITQVPKALREAATRSTGMKDHPTVYMVTQGGPAEAAGVRRGDILAAVNDTPTPTMTKASAALNEALEPARKGKPVKLALKRDGQQLEAVVTPAVLCAYPVVLSDDPTVNAYANGKEIIVLTGMMNYVRSDDELAEILGHEMAHNNQGHITAKQANMMLGTLLLDLPLAVIGLNSNLGASMGSQAYSQDFEFEADYVGLYFTARAGYDIEHVADLWRRMAVEHPEAITQGSTHPSTSRRFVALELARDEIKAKIAEGRALMPEMKDRQPAADAK